MSTTTLCIIRHGETLWNVEQRIQGQGDSPLSPLGCRQARALAARLASTPVDLIISSDLQRAWRTAQTIAEHNGCPLLADPVLRERHFGLFEGLTREEIARQYPEHAHVLRAGPDTAPPGGESPRQFYQRIVTGVSRLQHDHAGQRLLLVTHGGVLSILFKFTVGLECQSPRHFALPNAAINTFEVTDEQWTLVQWGDTRHCDGLDGCGEETVSQ